MEAVGSGVTPSKSRGPASDAGVPPGVVTPPVGFDQGTATSAALCSGCHAMSSK